MQSKWLISILWCVFILPGVDTAFSQSCSGCVSSPEADSLLAAGPVYRTLSEKIVHWMLPEWIEASIRLKDFIRQDAFQRYRRTFGDPSAFDLIFRKGLRIAHGDIDQALVGCFISTMDHAKVGIRIPLLGVVVSLPLTGETAPEFALRHNHLPSRIYADSPPEGDRDKLQHFFGSALVAYASASGSYAYIIGNIIEVFEQSYIVGGQDDPRDRRANKQGVKFGKLLMLGKDVRPTDATTDSVKIQNRCELSHAESIHR